MLSLRAIERSEAISKERLLRRFAPRNDILFDVFCQSKEQIVKRRKI
jgi:hypothetical protein